MSMTKMYRVPVSLTANAVVVIFAPDEESAREFAAREVDCQLAIIGAELDSAEAGEILSTEEIPDPPEI